MENKIYKITGHKFSPEKHYYDFDKNRNYPTFKSIDTQHFTCEAPDIDSAYLWMLKNHPDYAVGCGITCTSNNDFLFDAVPDYYVCEFGLKDDTDFSGVISRLIEMTENRLNLVAKN